MLRNVKRPKNELVWRLDVFNVLNVLNVLNVFTVTNLPGQFCRHLVLIDEN
jgi:hypothetical protein